MTTHAPRQYQGDLERDCYGAWADGARNVLAVLPTGGGKTYVFSRIAAATKAAVAAVAHRSELVTQMSAALGREGVRHRVVGSAATRKEATRQHLDEFGRSFIDTTARVSVCSVDTLIGLPANEPWFAQVGLWIMDEAHHVLAENKWGKACAMFPHAYGLGVTATPIRADGKGLGRHAHGVFDRLVLGPAMRDLIEHTPPYLADYDVVCPQSDLDLSDVTVTASGDYSPEKLKAARRRSHITGDVVANYLKFARGRRAVVFDTDIESATDTCSAFKAAGVAAEVVTGKTPAELRSLILRRFRTGGLTVLVNVDLFGEGFDVPAIEVVIFARPTQSYSLYCQQFGRALRILAGKTRALVIDHVGNILRHGLPDKARAWSLDARERRARATPDDVVPLRTCLNPECLTVYERVLPGCPKCGNVPVPAARSAPEFVDGDLTLLDPEVLAHMRGAITGIESGPSIPLNAAPEVSGRLRRLHFDRMHALADLRAQMNLWAGWQTALGRSDAEAYRRFFHAFGTDAMTAQTLNGADLQALGARIAEVLKRNNIVKLGAT